jgi:hypothetical protein
MGVACLTCTMRIVLTNLSVIRTVSEFASQNVDSRVLTAT